MPLRSALNLWMASTIVRVACWMLCRFNMPHTHLCLPFTHLGHCKTMQHTVWYFYTHLYIYIYIYMFLSVRVYVCICICMCVYVYMHYDMSPGLLAGSLRRMLVWVTIYVYLYAYTYIHIYLCVYIWICTRGVCEEFPGKWIHMALLNVCKALLSKRRALLRSVWIIPIISHILNVCRLELNLKLFCTLQLWAACCSVLQCDAVL